MKYGRAVYIQRTLLVLSKEPRAKVSKYVNEVPDKDRVKDPCYAFGRTDLSRLEYIHKVQ